VWELRREDQTIGVALNFCDEKTFYYWLGGFDPRFANLRLGHTVVTHSIRESIELGRETYDFMLGGEAYKYEYGAKDRQQPWLVVTNPRGRSRAASLISLTVDRMRTTLRTKGGETGAGTG
jgi:CelD/BcsL family acetyltransferase involved in cellulose biosynthesis